MANTHTQTHLQNPKLPLAAYGSTGRTRARHERSPHDRPTATSTRVHAIDIQNLPIVVVDQGKCCHNNVCVPPGSTACIDNSLSLSTEPNSLLRRWLRLNQQIGDKPRGDADVTTKCAHIAVSVCHAQRPQLRCLHRNLARPRHALASREPLNHARFQQEGCPFRRARNLMVVVGVVG